MTAWCCWHCGVEGPIVREVHAPLRELAALAFARDVDEGFRESFFRNAERRVHVMRADAPQGTLPRSYVIEVRGDFPLPRRGDYRARLVFDYEEAMPWAV